MLDKQNRNTATFRATIEEVLNSEFPWVDSKHRNYTYEIDPDYDDSLGSRIIEKILKDPNPKEKFLQVLDERYTDYISYIQNELYKKVKQGILENSTLQPLTAFEEDMIKSFIQENISVLPPANHFLRQDVLVNLFIDTGDGSYDFSLNPHYPCFYGGRWREPIDSKAGIVWLAKQQGYTKKQLQNALDEGDISNPTGFLQSCRIEEANLSCSMPVISFLVRMELQELISINVLMQLSKQYKTNCSYVLLGCETITGLYDPFNGGGGLLGIQLERDVRLPIMYIRSALPDGCDGLSIRSCYGLDEDTYMSTVKEIYVSRKLRHIWSNLIL